MLQTININSLPNRHTTMHNKSIRSRVGLPCAWKNYAWEEVDLGDAREDQGVKHGE